MEKLKFNVRPNLRLGNRVEVMYKKQQNKGKTFIDSYQEDATPDFLNKLDAQELFEVEWFNQCLAFNREHFNKTAVDVEKTRLFLAPDFFDALVKLSQEAKKHEIPYHPMESMLNSLLEKAKATERHINKKSETPINILASLGIDLERGNEHFQEHRKFEKGRVIFEELVNISGYYNQFLALAKERFKKEKINASPKHFLGYSKGHSIPSKWYYSVALEILAKNKVDVFNLGLDDETIVSYWLNPLISTGYEKSELINLFNGIFKKNIEML